MLKANVWEVWCLWQLFDELLSNMHKKLSQSEIINVKLAPQVFLKKSANEKTKQNFILSKICKVNMILCLPVRKHFVFRIYKFLDPYLTTIIKIISIYLHLIYI